jgi:hypothetical protein
MNPGIAPAPTTRNRTSHRGGWAWWGGPTRLGMDTRRARCGHQPSLVSIPTPLRSHTNRARYGDQLGLVWRPTSIAMETKPARSGHQARLLWTPSHLAMDTDPAWCGDLCPLGMDTKPARSGHQPRVVWRSRRLGVETKPGWSAATGRSAPFASEAARPRTPARIPGCRRRARKHSRGRQTQWRRKVDVLEDEEALALAGVVVIEVARVVRRPNHRCHA